MPSDACPCEILGGEGTHAPNPEGSPQQRPADAQTGPARPDPATRSGLSRPSVTRPGGAPPTAHRRPTARRCRFGRPWLPWPTLPWRGVIVTSWPDGPFSPARQPRAGPDIPGPAARGPGSSTVWTRRTDELDDGQSGPAGNLCPAIVFQHTVCRYREPRPPPA
jgi:hypothetical protein